jgi:hypothetical protein
VINHFKILTFLARKLKENKKHNREKGEPRDETSMGGWKMKRKRTFMMIVTYLLIVFWLVEVYPPMFEDKNIV